MFFHLCIKFSYLITNGNEYKETLNQSYYKSWNLNRINLYNMTAHLMKEPLLKYFFFSFIH